MMHCILVYLSPVLEWGQTCLEKMTTVNSWDCLFYSIVNLCAAYSFKNKVFDMRTLSESFVRPLV